MLIPLPSAAVEILAGTPRFTGPYISTTAGGPPARPGIQPSEGPARRGAPRIRGSPSRVLLSMTSAAAVRSGLGRLGVPAVVAELCLGHRQPGIVGIYDRHSYLDEKRDALRRWEAHLMSIVAPPRDDDAGEVVVPLRARVRA